MKMAPEDITTYPQFHQYVSTMIPTVRNMPFIINALKTFSGNGSEAKIKEALEWNKGPQIKLVMDLMCGTVKAVGCYTDGVNAIEIEEKRVKEFEDGRGLRRTASGKLVYYVGVTLLHELCHWANDGTGKPDQTHEKFEQTLYGKVI
jgi:hypothetical protein